MISSNLYMCYFQFHWYNLLFLEFDSCMDLNSLNMRKHSRSEFDKFNNVGGRQETITYETKSKACENRAHYRPCSG